MAVFVIGAIDVKDWDVYQNYIDGAAPLIGGGTVQPLSIDRNPTLVEGDLPAPYIVLLRFDDQKAFDDFYKSDTYQNAMKHRHAAAKTNFLITVEGLPGA